MSGSLATYAELGENDGVSYRVDLVAAVALRRGEARTAAVLAGARRALSAGTIETAITAIRLGAYDYLSKPYRMAEIDVLVRRAWERRQLARENALLHNRLSRVAEPS